MKSNKTEDEEDEKCYERETILHSAHFFFVPPFT